MPCMQAHRHTTHAICLMYIHKAKHLCFVNVTKDTVNECFGESKMFLKNPPEQPMCVQPLQQATLNM